MNYWDRKEWTVYVCPECNTLYADASSMCECLPGTELVAPEPIVVVPKEPDENS